MPIRLSLLFVSLLLIAGGAYWLSNVSLVDDKEPPTLKIKSSPRGLGEEAHLLEFSIQDLGAGLDRVTVNLKQRGYSKELFREALKGVKDFESRLEVKADQGYLVEGPAELEIKVIDRSFAGNPQIKLIPVQVDFKAPRLIGISSQHNLQLSGVQLAFYQVQERALFESGVQVGDLRFKGFPAKFIDSTFEAEDAYAVVYTVPEGVTSKPYLFAEDLAGNLVKASFYNLVLRRSFSKLKITVKPSAIKKILGDATLLQQDSLEQAESRLQELRQQANLEIAKIEQTGQAERMWRGAFQKPAGSVRTSFGAKMSLDFGGERLLSFTESGYAFSDPGQDRAVYAPNSGVIIFAGELPFYGSSLIISHGFGLSTLLGNISQIEVQPGQRVHADQVLAQRADDGLFGNGTIFYEMRLQGVPIEPREWWDDNWLQQHFDDKVREAKGNYGQ